MALELGRGFKSVGYSPHFLTSRWNNGDFTRRLRESELSFEIMPLGYISASLTLNCLRMTADQLVRWPRLVWSYRKMLQKTRPKTIIHTNWHHLIVLWPFLKPQRDFFWLHETIPNSNRYHQLFQRLTHRIGKFICVSDAVARSLHALDVQATKIRVIHNGIADPACGGSTRSFSSEPVNIGIVGQVGPWKGHEDLLLAFEIAIRRCPNARLHVFGSGTEEFVEGLRRLAHQLSVEDRTVWHGFINERASIYSSMDLCIVPSRFDEPFGLVAVEPAFFKIPVIATRRGGLPEIVQDGVTGILVDAEAPAQLADAICQLIENPSLRQKMGEAARSGAVKRFSHERFIAEFLDAIDMSPAPVECQIE